MCFTEPQSLEAADSGSRSGNFASSAAKSMICPCVLSMTVTPFILAVNGRASRCMPQKSVAVELSNTVTW